MNDDSHFANSLLEHPVMLRFFSFPSFLALLFLEPDQGLSIKAGHMNQEGC